MSAKLNKIELSEELMVMWRERTGPLRKNMSPLYRDKNEKDKSFRSSHRQVFCKIGVLRNFTKFTGEHLCQSPFLIKL